MYSLYYLVLRCSSDFCAFIVQWYCTYSLYYILLHCSSDLFAVIAKLYCTYYLYYLVLCCSSDFCSAYLDYSAALTKTLRTLAAPTQLVASTASCRPSISNGGSPVPAALPHPSTRLQCPVPIGSTRPINTDKPASPSHF